MKILKTTVKTTGAGNTKKNLINVAVARKKKSSQNVVVNVKEKKKKNSINVDVHKTNSQTKIMITDLTTNLKMKVFAIAKRVIGTKTKTISCGKDEGVDRNICPFCRITKTFAYNTLDVARHLEGVV